jgi:phosphatidylglycerol:prolipoprotein diacylglycerol transferase
MSLPIVWDVSREIFSIGSFSLRWYGLLFAVGFALGHEVVKVFYKLEKKPIQDLSPLLTTMIVSTILGARVGHCFFYEPEYYFANPEKILAVWEGGLASHGATAGIMIGMWFFSRAHPSQPYLWLLERLAIGVSLGAFFVRLGNLFNSEIVGRVTDVPWAFVFKKVDMLPRHPAQLYEALWYLATFVVLFTYAKKVKGQFKPGLVLGSFFISIYGSRFFIEYFKENQVSFETDLLSNYGFNMGQFLSVPFVLLGLYLILRRRPV